MNTITSQNKKILEVKAKWNNYERVVESREISDKFNTALAASFTIEPIVPLFGSILLNTHKSPAFQIAPYNQLFQACLNPGAVFNDFHELNAICLFWRIEDLAASELELFLNGELTALEAANQKIEELFAAVKTLRTNFNGTIVITTPPFPQNVYTDLNDLDNIKRAGYFHTNILGRCYSLMSNIKDIQVLDLDGIQRDFGASRAVDNKKWYLYKQPYKESFLLNVAGNLGRIFKTIHTQPKKCLVLDCDNTLWGGVVGEDGIQGIEIGDEFPGSAFRDFQKLLLKWHNQGVFLTLLSKNNDPDVWEVFENHDAMVLRKEHIAAWRINWNSKADNILEIARELNIGTDSFVFIDDSPFEIEQMLEANPEVMCIQVPEDHALMADKVKKLYPFDRLDVTEEDRRRTKMILQERDRTELKSRVAESEFLNSLGLRLHIFSPKNGHIARVTQLINKTNQFNLTTIRRTQEEVQEIMGSGEFRIYTLQVEDRYGEYGLTGLAILQDKNNSLYIDTFLLSCRVLGRKIETAFLSFIARRASVEGKKTIYAKYVPTSKNKPIENFLPDHSFSQAENDGWSIAVENVPKTPAFISIAQG